MIAEFTIENFSSVKSPQTISFQPNKDSFMFDEYSYEIKEGVRLLKIGIIYGSNASGKTNILKAIEFFRSLVLRIPKDRTEAIKVIPFMLDSTSRNKKTKMSMVFYLNQTKHILSFELDKNYIYSESLIVYDSIRPTKLYGRSYDAETDSTAIEFGTNLRMSKKSQDVIAGNTINNCSVLAAFGKSNVERTRLNEVYDYFANHVNEILAPGMLLYGYVKTQLNNDVSGELKKFLLGFLKASDFNIEDFILHKTERQISPELERLIQKVPIGDEEKAEIQRKVNLSKPELIFKHKAGNALYDLSEEYESNGTMRFMAMAVVLNFLLKTNRFVLIDEVETSLHYELLAYFLKVFLANSEGTSQMLLTTHDINLLNEDFIRRDAIWFTDKNELGETELLPVFRTRAN